MTWPFLGAVGSTSAIAPTAPATTLTPAQQLVLAPRTAQRRRYLSMNEFTVYQTKIPNAKLNPFLVCLINYALPIYT